MIQSRKNSKKNIFFIQIKKIIIFRFWDFLDNFGLLGFLNIYKYFFCVAFLDNKKNSKKKISKLLRFLLKVT